MASGAYTAGIIKAEKFDETGTIGFRLDEYEERIDYCINEAFIFERITAVETIPYFPGILNLSSEGYQIRKQTLLNGSMAKTSENNDERSKP